MQKLDTIQKAVLQLLKKNKNHLLIKFQEPQLAITPGQSIVFYVNNKLVGGGIIKLYE